MNLESLHGFQHITDALNGNAIVTLFFFVLALISIKVIATLAGAMVRDDARTMDWYQSHVEGKNLPFPGSPEKNERSDSGV